MDLTNLNKNRQERWKSSIDLSTMVYGKVPPQAKDLEEVVLGAIMLEKGALDIVSEILVPESFYVEAHQRIYRTMQRLSHRGAPIDILTVIEELKSSEELDLVGGPYYVTRLTNSVVSAANIEYHSKIIRHKFVAREIIRVAGEMIGDAYEDSTNAMELLQESEEKVFQIGKSVLGGDMKPISAVIMEAMTKIEEWRTHDSTITGVPSGFRALDKATRGWQDGDFIVIGARPSMGKTAFALKLIHSAAIAGVPVAMWSLEMKAMRLVLRMLSSASGIHLHRIQTGRLDDAHMVKLHNQGVVPLADLNIFFDEKTSVTLMEVKAKSRRLKSKHNIGLIVVDYLQLMRGHNVTKQNREQVIAEISRELKNLAGELEVPVIALSQLNRDVEKRSDKEPEVSDIRESGAIEQDADVVILLYGPTDSEIENDASLMTRKKVKIGKQRDGMLVTVDVEFESDIQRWSEIDTTKGFKPVSDLFETQGDVPFKK